MVFVSNEIKQSVFTHENITVLLMFKISPHADASSFENL